nr:hypothetical protein [uncultured Arsenicibacter sp.]
MSLTGHWMGGGGADMLPTLLLPTLRCCVPDGTLDGWGGVAPTCYRLPTCYRRCAVVSLTGQWMGGVVLPRRATCHRPATDAALLCP